MSSLGSLGGPGSPRHVPHPSTIPEDEEVQDTDVATLLPDLFSGDWGAEPIQAPSAPKPPAGETGKPSGSGPPLEATQVVGSGSFVLRGGGAAAVPPSLPPSRPGHPGDFPGFSLSPRGAGGFQPPPAPPKKKPGILSSLTAGPAFLQKQLRKAQAGGGGPPSPPVKGDAAKGAGVRPKLPLKHAVTEPTSKLFDFLRDARAGGAEVPEPLIQQISSMEPQQEEPEELFLPASAALDRVPFYRRRAFWVSNLLLALWSLTFVDAGVGLFIEMQDCPIGCPGPTDAAQLVPPPAPKPLDERNETAGASAQWACWGPPGCRYDSATNQPSAGCACVSVNNTCYSQACDTGKIDNDSIAWRVMFFLACIPGESCVLPGLHPGWASHCLHSRWQFLFFS
ncbi:hypothetical protein ABPG75_012149 [Micractinium tetrahymenae]